MSSVHSQKRGTSLEEKMTEQRLCDHPEWGGMGEG